MSRVTIVIFIDN